MESLKIKNLPLGILNEFSDIADSEIFREISHRICNLHLQETGRTLDSEVLSFIFEDGEIIEIRTDTNETIFEE